MSFRQSTNRHDWWDQYRQKYGIQYQDLGIPTPVLDTEQRLVDFLTTGIDAGTCFKLEQLDKQGLWSLSQIVTAAFDYEAATFTAFEKRRLAKNR